MPFKKGTSGNPAGARVRNQQQNNHKDSAEVLNQKIKNYLEKNFDSVFSGEDSLKSQGGRETARIYCELLKYSVPRLAPKRTDIRFENLTTEQLDEIIEILQHNAPKSTLANLMLNR